MYFSTIKNIFIDNETYIACKHDFSDLKEKIELILGDTKKYYYIVENARKQIINSMNPDNLALHLHQTLTQLNSISV